MIKIGFVDYFLDEWHANNYPEKFATASANIGIPCEIVGAFATLDAPNFDGKRTTDEWCRDYGIKRYNTVEELAEVCDAFLVFSPDNPENHPELARLTLPFGKPTFIDKTFAVSEEDAVYMIKLAEEYGTPMYSSSALRYATELEAAKGKRDISVRGGFVDINNYIVHTAEMVVTALGIGISDVKCEILDGVYSFDVNYSDGKTARIEMASNYDFSVNGEPVVSAFFEKQIENILRFFNGEEKTVDNRETLEIARFVVAAKAAIKNSGKAVKLA